MMLPKPYLESTIVTNKGSIEKSKAMIDKLCTLRTLMPDQFRPTDIEKVLDVIRDVAYMCIVPKQTDDFYRLVVIKTTIYTKELLHLFYKACYMVPMKSLHEPFPALYAISFSLNICCITLMLATPIIRKAMQKRRKRGEDVVVHFLNPVFTLVDYMRLYDYQRGVDVIYDLTDSDVKEALSVINFMEFKDCYEIVHHSYSLRVRRYIVITPSKWVELLVNVFKTFMKKKIADRIMVLKDYTELHQFYSKDILPQEYGGEEKCLKDLQDEIFKHAAAPKHREFREKLFEARTDETKRSPDVFSELYAGTTGTFRALTLD